MRTAALVLAGLAAAAAVRADPAAPRTRTLDRYGARLVIPAAWIELPGAKDLAAELATSMKAQHGAADVVAVGAKDHTFAAQAIRIRRDMAAKTVRRALVDYLVPKRNPDDDHWDLDETGRRMTARERWTDSAGAVTMHFDVMYVAGVDRGHRLLAYTIGCSYTDGSGDAAAVTCAEVMASAVVALADKDLLPIEPAAGGAP
jgi:hypothetical protein